MAPATANHNVRYKFAVEMEVNCSANEFYRMYRHNAKEMPNCLPHIYPKVEHLEGDGVSIGSVKHWHYVLEEGGKSSSAKERMTVGDDEKRMITFSFFEGEMMNDYKLFDVTLVVTPKETCGGQTANVSVVTWSVEYEKAHEAAPVPTVYIDCIARVTRDLNAHLLARSPQAPAH